MAPHVFCHKPHDHCLSVSFLKARGKLHAGPECANVYYLELRLGESVSLGGLVAGHSSWRNGNVCWKLDLWSWAALSWKNQEHLHGMSRANHHDTLRSRHEPLFPRWRFLTRMIAEDKIWHIVSRLRHRLACIDHTISNCRKFSKVLQSIVIQKAETVQS